MNLSDEGAALIESFEGFSAVPYRDTNGVWTQGFGSQHGVTGSSPPITLKQADARLRAEVEERFGPAVEGLGLPLTQYQHDALVSLAYNVGPGVLDAKTALGGLLRAHAWAAAADAILAYDKADMGGGRLERLPGLTRRRVMERALFLKRDLSHYTAAELRWIREYDGLRRAGTAPGRRRVLQRRMTEQRKRIWHAAQSTGWERYNRAARYRSLMART